MKRSRLALAAGLLAIAAVVVGCGRSDSRAQQPQQERQNAPATAIRVTTIDIGSGIRADKRVATPMLSFRPDQTVYASVATEGASPRATLTARWTYQDGQVVSESTETIAPSGPAVTEFHVSKPGGWPAGRYAVEILLDGSPVARREFEVRG